MSRCPQRFPSRSAESRMCAMGRVRRRRRWSADYCGSQVHSERTMTPKLYTLAEAASSIHKSARWLRSWLRGRGGIGKLAGRTRLFTEADVLRIIGELEPCPSNCSRPKRAGRRTSTSAADALRSPLTEALALATERSPSSSSGRSKTKSSVVAMPNRATPRSPQQP